MCVGIHGHGSMMSGCWLVSEIGVGPSQVQEAFWGKILNLPLRFADRGAAGAAFQCDLDSRRDHFDRETALSVNVIPDATAFGFPSQTESK